MSRVRAFGGGKNICHICRGIGSSESGGRLMAVVADDGDHGVALGGKKCRETNLARTRRNTAGNAIHRYREQARERAKDFIIAVETPCLQKKEPGEIEDERSQE